MLVALLFCLALAKAARKPVPTFTHGDVKFAADQAEFAGEGYRHPHAGLTAVHGMRHAA